MALTNNWSFDDPSIGLSSSITIDENKIHANYPCSNSTRCTPLRIQLPRGRYLFELAGGSGYIKPSLFIPGERPEDSPLSGGYVSGVISLKEQTEVILNIGGMGIGNIGGYNGGGSGLGNKNTNGGGGGGTDIVIGKNDPFHRILVAGGGGGSDDQDHASLEANEGNGGSGGGLQSKSFYVGSSYIAGFESTQTTGFSFFQGETGKASGTSHPLGYKYQDPRYEHSGGGGGWFGGFSSNHYDGGSAGGSSFALSHNSTVPIGIIHVYNANYVSILEGIYAFDPRSSPFLFENISHKRGVWNGNGFVIITRISFPKNAKCSILCNCSFYAKRNLVVFCTLLSIFEKR